MMDFRAAKESELPLIWQALKSKNIFPSYEALKNFQQENAFPIQTSAENLSCVGVIGSWRSHLNVGSIKALIAEDAYKKQFVKHLISILGERDFQEIVSPPLRPVDLGAFCEAGFRAYERIAVLKKTDYSRPPSRPGSAEICQFKPAYLSSLLSIEEACFTSFWQLGKEELVSAIEAGHCFVAFFKGEIIGYNINVIKDKTGAVSRLAVPPWLQGQGFGSQLLSYSFNWFQKESVRSIFVTTQTTNRRAQRLYTKFGFVLLDEDRYVLRLEL